MATAGLRPMTRTTHEQQLAYLAELPIDVDEVGCWQIFHEMEYECCIEPVSALLELSRMRGQCLPETPLPAYRAGAWGGEPYSA